MSVFQCPLPTPFSFTLLNTHMIFQHLCFFLAPSSLLCARTNFHTFSPFATPSSVCLLLSAVSQGFFLTVVVADCCEKCIFSFMLQAILVLSLLDTSTCILKRGINTDHSFSQHIRKEKKKYF